MKFSFLDVILAVLSGIFIFSSALFIAWGCNHLVFVPDAYKAICQVVVFILSFFSLSIIILWIIRTVCPLPEKTLQMDTDRHAIIWKLQGFLYVFNLGLFINSYIVPVNMRAFVFSLLGTKIGRCVMIGGKILEPALVEIGDHTMLGEDTLLTAHAVEGNKVTLGRIKVGKGVTVGVKAVILPDVKIGDHSIVAAGAVVKKGTRILSREIWGGIPAKKIGDVKD